VAAIKEGNPKVQVKIVPLDLLSHKSVRAAVMATRKFVVSEDGVESQFAANYLSHFLLSVLMVKNGLIGSGAVILNVGSLGYQMADIEYDNVNFTV
jgi:NAD(P)-dependent dehydrogenase (short-subunit alcohol dehydrogenase family)